MRCQKGGQKLHAKHFLIIVTPSPTGLSRLATAVTTKIDKRAVVRNLIKRRIREVFRAIRSDLSRALDVVVIARNGIQDCDFSDYRRQIVGAFLSRGFITRSNQESSSKGQE